MPGTCRTMWAQTEFSAGPNVGLSPPDAPLHERPARLGGCLKTASTSSIPSPSFSRYRLRRYARPRRWAWRWPMAEDRLYLIDTFAFILSVSAAPIRETSPLGVEVAHG